MPHRVADGGLVGDLSASAFLAPADDDEEGVVDRDPEPDERDEELDDHGDVGDVRDRPDEQKRGRDSDGRHQQRHDRHERAEDEDEDEQGAERADQCLDEHSGAARLALGRRCTERVHPGHLDRRAGDGDAGERRLGLLCLCLSGVHATDGGVVDERERGAAVVGDEGAVVGGGVGGDPDVRHRLLHLRERRGELAGDARRVHGRALWKGDDGNERSDVAAAAVDLRDVLVGLVALAAGNVELLRECVSRRSDRRERGDRDNGPERDDESLVAENHVGEAIHDQLPSSRLQGVRDTVEHPLRSRQDLLPFPGNAGCAAAAGSLGCLWLLCSCLQDVAPGLPAPSGMTLRRP